MENIKKTISIKKYLIKKIILLILFLSLIPNVFADMMINEIMYNPEGSDNNKEFIEIFSYPQIDISNYIISDGDSDDALIL